MKKCHTTALSRGTVKKSCLLFFHLFFFTISPARAGTITGVTPTNGPFAGGNTLAITGVGLGDGSDITNVTLCGVDAAVQTGQSATQVVVVAGAALVSGPGDVIVQSISQGTTILTNGYIYNPQGYIHGALHWSSISNLPAARYYLAAVVAHGKLYAIGGYDSVMQSTVYTYDPSQPTAGWTSVSNLPAARGYPAAMVVSGTIYAVGGYDASWTPQSTVYRYDPLQPEAGWTSVSNLPGTRACLGGGGEHPSAASFTP